MAVLFDTWTAPDSRNLHTCTIITTRPNSLMEKHPRLHSGDHAAGNEEISLNWEKKDAELRKRKARMHIQ